MKAKSKKRKCKILAIQSEEKKGKTLRVYYKGQVQCTECKRKAYYSQDEKPLCGYHSDKFARKNLPVDPKAKEKRENQIKGWFKDADIVARRRLMSGKPGTVFLQKMKFFKTNKPLVEGALLVYPNFKHGGRKDGLGIPDLSPKSIGPITHFEPLTPISMNLENYHQFSKVFPWEVKNYPKDNGKDVRSKLAKLKPHQQIEAQTLLHKCAPPAEEFYKRRDKAFQSEIPHRHKFTREEIKKRNNGTSVNIPLYAVHTDKEGQERRYTYLQSRWFYCHYYEKHVQNNPNFLRLKSMLKRGYILQICGYDAYEIEEDKTLYDCYMDTSKPFGHELVLYTMLVEKRSEKYPWNIFYSKYSELYKPLSRD